MHNRLSFEPSSESSRQPYPGRRIIGAFCLTLSLAACATESEPSPTPTIDSPQTSIQFNHPDGGSYFLDTPDQYYDNLLSTREITDDPIAKDNINRLLDTPVAQWLNSTIDSAQQAIKENLDQSKIEGTIPLFVAYNIPHRDLGGEARGGMLSAAEYQDWIRSISESIGDASAIIILEPDAIAGVPLMTDPSEQAERITLLRDALLTFQQNNDNTAVYLDIGNSRWLSTQTAADLIRQVDPETNLVGGIALNVSNQRSSDESRAYAAEISALLGYELRVMIDSSMNGAPNTDSLLKWCNADGEHIGTPEDTFYNPDQMYEEAYIKVPGESDGQCGESTKKAGEFDPDLLIKQVS